MASTPEKKNLWNTVDTFMAGIPTFAGSDSWEEDVDNYFKENKGMLEAMSTSALTSA